MRVFNNRQFSPAKKETSAPEKKKLQRGEVVPGKEAPRKSSSEIRARMEELKKETQAKKFERARKMNEKRLQGNQYMNEGEIAANIASGRSQAEMASELEAQKKAKMAEAEGGDHVQAGEGHVLNSDITNNAPDSVETQEKLKKVLSTGAFSFNEKERAVLDKILGQEGP